MIQLRQVIKTPSASHLDIEGKELEKHPQNNSRKFPDGEVYVKVPEIDENGSVLVIHSGMPDPNQGLSYLYGILEKLKEYEVRTEVLFTYFPYGMQDQKYHQGGLNYARSIIKKLDDYYKVERIHVIDPHFGNQGWVEEYPVDFLSGFTQIQDTIHNQLNSKVQFIGPDQGTEQAYGLKSLEKDRRSAKEVDVKGKFGAEADTMIVFDDIIETGGTMCQTYEKLKEEGVSNVYAAAAHGVLDEGVKKVVKRFDGLYLTNTIKNQITDCHKVKVENIIRQKIDLDSKT